MKKHFPTLLIAMMLLALIGVLTSCNIGGMQSPIPTTENTVTNQEGTNPEETTVSDELYKLEIQTVFEMAKEAGYTGTLDELIAMFKGETGPAGKDGVTPHIGANGHWWVGDTDLGILAQGTRGEQGIQGEKGDKGDDGRGILKVEIIDGCLWITYTDAPDTPINIGRVIPEETTPEATTPEATTPEATTPEESILTTPGLAYEVNDDGETCTITGIGTCTESDIVIGNDIDGYKITTVGYYAFSRCSELTSVTFGDSVTTIGYQSFWGCSKLTSVTIPDSVTTIGTDAFWACDSLIQVENGISYVDKWVIDCDTSVISGILRENTIGIGNCAFASCFKLTSVTIPDSVTTIGAMAFRGCSNLTSVTIGDSVTTIGDFTFDGCSKLESIIVDENNVAYQSINENLYSKDGTVLIAYAIGKTDTTFVFPESVTIIGELAFLGCSNLTSVTISDAVTTIGDQAFFGCSNLMSVTIGDSVTTIGAMAFSNCSELTSVTFGDSVTTIGVGAFQACSKLTGVMIGDSVTTIGERAFSNCSNLTTVTISNSVITIGVAAFEYCSNLMSVTIGASVTTIDVGAFIYCYILTDVYYTGSEAEWAQITIYSNNDELTNATIHYNYVLEE